MVVIEKNYDHDDVDMIYEVIVANDFHDTMIAVDDENEDHVDGMVVHHGDDKMVVVNLILMNVFVMVNENVFDLSYDRYI